MSDHPAITALQSRVRALLQPQDKQAYALDVDTFSRAPKPGGKPAVILVGIATHQACAVLAIDAAEFTEAPAAAVLRVMGLKDAVKKVLTKVVRRK